MSAIDPRQQPIAKRPQSAQARPANSYGIEEQPLLAVGQQAIFEYTNGHCLKGVVGKIQRYTIWVEEEKGGPLIVYKSALRCIRVRPAAPKQKQPDHVPIVTRAMLKDDFSKPETN